MGLRSRYGLIGIDTGRGSIPLSERRSSQLAQNSIVFGIGSLPEAKIGLVKGMPKIERGSCELHIPHQGDDEWGRAIESCM
jgi:hypothetical protein